MTDVLICASVVVVFAYLFATWWRIGRDPKPDVLVARYEPPPGLSPAMLRYIWKEAFDDRTFWAAVLSLVAKGLATLEPSDGDIRMRPTVATTHAPTLPEEERWLALAVVMMYLWPSGWRWQPNQPEYEQMILGVYATLGIFLLLASRNPSAHRSLIAFTAWSSLVHAGIMAVQAFHNPSERGHLLGDVPALFVVWLALIVLPPARQAGERASATGA